MLPSEVASMYRGDRSYRVRAALSAVLLVAGSLSTPNTALAAHSLPTPPTYWDCNVDGFADDTCVRGWKAGVGWNVGATNRFNDAFAEWATDTDFDPIASTTGQAVYKDRNAFCEPDWTPPGGGVILGVVCLSVQWRLESYYRILSTPTYLNDDLDESGLSWWYGAGQPNQNTIHFGGNLTHELGHWVFLNDLNCAPGATMCNGNQTEDDVWDQFTLELDDKNAANQVYP